MGTLVSPATDLARRVREAALLKGDFVLSSGKRSRFYLDKYLFSTEPGLLRSVAAELARHLPPDTQRLAGVELGAVPLAVAASLETGLPYVIVRRAAKDYGTGRTVEGRFSAGERIVLIEDVVTTGAQAVRAAEGLAESGVEVVAILAVLDRREGGRNPQLGAFPFRALLRMEDLGVEKGD